MKKLFILYILTLFFFPLFTYSQTYLRKTNLPHIYINTFNGANISSKTDYVYCKLVYVDENDVITQYDSVSIRGRGNSTWGLAKKPYKIKFNEKQKFLGKGYANAKDWTLLANAGDKTLIRNALTSEMAKYMGMRFVPAAKFVDLTLNGSYQGNYQISDQVEVKNHRVDIVEQDYPLVSSSNITGGYLLEVDGFKEKNWFSSSKNVAIRIHYPDEDEIVSSQNSYIRNYVNSFEKALFSADFKDPNNGYRPFVDSLSLANLYLVTEITGNIDGFWSMYFYKNQNDSLFYFGPAWDYDIAYNNDYRIQPTQNKLMVDEGYGDAKTWFRQMWNDNEWFSKLINRRFEQLIDNGIEEYLYQKIDSLTQLLDESQIQNYKKWSISSRMYHEISMHSTYDEYINDLKAFIHEHLLFLERAFANRLPQEPTPPFQPRAYYYNILNAKTNNAIDVYTPDGIEYNESNLPLPGTIVCSWSPMEPRPTQYWRIEPVGEYFSITNQLGLALNDPTPGTSTATTNVGTQLNVTELNTEDLRQLWIILPQGTQGYYNIINAYTQHTANLNGGNSANGTEVISYTTDDRNSISTNRLWYIAKTSIKLPEILEPDPSFDWVFAKGWNWAAHSMKQPISVDEFKDNAEHILAQHYETYFDNEQGFTGSLESMKSGSLYKFFMKDNASYTFNGDFCDSNQPVPLMPGWNWVGYTNLKEGILNESLIFPNADENDIIVGQQGFSVFSNGVWTGSINQLNPGTGYLYYTNSTKTIQFTVLNTESNKKSPKRIYQNNYSNFLNIYAFPNVMGVIAVIKPMSTDDIYNHNDSSSLDNYSLLSDLSILAFDEEGNIRGVGEFIKDRFFVTIYGNGGEMIHFRAIDKSNIIKYYFAESIQFSSEVKGTIDMPMQLSVSDSNDYIPTLINEYTVNNCLNLEKQIIGCYSISGRYLGNSIDQLPNGIYIVIFNDGTCVKMVVK